MICILVTSYDIRDGYGLHIKCINNTKESYFFGVYQEFPESPGLKSVAWQVRGVPPGGSIPSTSDITWTLTYGVSVAME